MSISALFFVVVLTNLKFGYSKGLYEDRLNFRTLTKVESLSHINDNSSNDNLHYYNYKGNLGIKHSLFHVQMHNIRR